LYIYNITHKFLNTSQGENNKNLLLSIPIDVKPNSVIIYKTNSEHALNTNDNIFNSIGFKLCDEEGNIIDLNGMEWSILLELTFIDFVNDNI